MTEQALALLGAYLLGSTPTALIVSRFLGRGDIRLLGDGNMGARNVAREIGLGAGAVVGAVDFSKGALAVWAAQQASLSEPWLLAAGVAAVLGHDFPIWAGFRGGQGMATSLGALAMLLPVPTLVGLLAFGSLYLATRGFDVSAAGGLGLIVLAAWRIGAPILWVIYAAFLFASIGIKKLFDRPRREALLRLGEGGIGRP